MFSTADVISAYSREEAIADGQLIDVTNTAKKMGLRFPVALTNNAWSQCVEWSDEKAGATGMGGHWASRLGPLLTEAIRAILLNKDGDMVTFTISCIPGIGPDTQEHTYELWMTVGPGDNAEPVITIMLPEDY